MADKQRGKFNKQQGETENEDDETEKSYQKARKEALLQNSQHRDSGYQVAGKGYDVSVSVDKKNAYKELESLQRSAIANYQTWAAETLKYNALENDAAAKNLKQYNDTYTMTMLMGVIAPLERGCDLGSVLQCMVSYNIIRTLNPNLDMDSSRMYYNFRNTIAPMVADLTQSHPIAGRFLGNTLLKGVDRTLSSAGGAKFASTIDAHEKVHDIDSMYLTPRQVAALKVNFMEQYYTDLRSTSDPYERKNFTDEYCKSLKHLEAICHNGGYDMSVVAAEERYLVSLKMEANPKYAMMFKETSDVFGARVDKDAVKESGRWYGQFITSDNHEWFGTEDIASNGAFHVRYPMDKETMDKDLFEHARKFNEMRAYVSGPMFTGEDGKIDANRKKLLAEIDKHEDEYLERMKVMALNDGLGDLDMKKEYRRVKTSVTDENNHRFDASSRYSEDFVEELDLVLRTDVIKRMGYDVSAMRANTRRRFDYDSEEYVRMAKDLTEYGNAKGLSFKGPDDLLNNMQLHYFEDLSAADQYELLAHTVTNIDQGYADHKSNREGLKRMENGGRLSALADLDFGDSEASAEDTFDTSLT